MIITITEALAEIKLIQKKIEGKRDFILKNLTRLSQLKDPLDNSEKVIQNETQAIHDLETRLMNIRYRIAASNMGGKLTVHGETRTVTDWLTWKREIYPVEHFLLTSMDNTIHRAKTELSQQMIRQGVPVGTVDVVVNVDEVALHASLEHLSDVFNQLDGALSLYNAITTIEVGE